MQNHCRSFRGSDGKYYRNELSFDGSNGDTLAITKLQDATLDDEDTRMLDAWRIILEEAKKCEEYDPEITYGLFQIHADLDTFEIDENDVKVWNHRELHSALQTMKTLIRGYYNKEIVPTLFEYELLK